MYCCYILSLKYSFVSESFNITQLHYWVGKNEGCYVIDNTGQKFLWWENSNMTKKMLTLLIVLCLPMQSTVKLNGIMYNC